MSCPLSPLGDRVILRRERFKSSSIIIPEDAARRNAPTRGVVVAKGPACEWPITLGGTYLHGRHAGDWINAEGKAVSPEDGEFYVLAEGDLLAEVTNV